MPYSAENKRIAREFLASVRSNTVCAKCGEQPVDFHSEDHITHPTHRVAHLAALGFPISRIQAEINKCEALCRKCHMQDDGRLSGLRDIAGVKKGDVFVEPRPCTVCGIPSKPTWRGMCKRDYDATYRPDRQNIT